MFKFNFGPLLNAMQFGHWIFLDELNLSQYRLAVDIGIPDSRVTAIVKSQRSITPETALRLARYFGTSAEFWIGLQKD